MVPSLSQSLQLLEVRRDRGMFSSSGALLPTSCKTQSSDSELVSWSSFVSERTREWERGESAGDQSSRDQGSGERSIDDVEVLEGADDGWAGRVYGTVQNDFFFSAIIT